MGLLANILEWLGGIIRGLVEWVLEQIENVSNESKIRRLIFRDELARLMQEDLFFLGYTVWAVGMGIMGAGLSVSVAAWWQYQLTQGWVAALALKLATSNLALRFQQLRLISQIAALIFPEYRNIVKDVYSALAGVSKIIYKSTEFMSTLMLSSRKVVYNAMILTGHDPKTSEVLAYMEAEPWITKVNTRYRRYVENPYLIMDDLEDEVIKPALALFSAENLERMEKWNEAYDLATEGVDNLQALNDSLIQWIDLHPDDIAAVMDDKVGQALEDVQGFLEDTETDILDVIGQSLDLANQKIAANEMRMLALAARFPDLAELIYEFYTLSGQDRQDAVNMLRELINKDLAYSTLQVRSVVDQRYNDYKAELYKLYAKGFQGLPEDEKLVTVGAVAPLPAIPTGSWYVGEY